MSNNYKSNPDKFLLSTIIATITFCVCVSVPAQQIESESSAVIEEIIVYGDKSLNRLRLEQRRAEDDFFTVFSSLTQNADFKVDCSHQAKMTGKRWTQVCVPEFVQKIEADTAAATLDDFRGIGRSAFVNRLSRKQEDQFWQEVANLVIEHPELRKALAQLATTKQNFESERERRCKDRFWFCRR